MAAKPEPAAPKETPEEAKVRIEKETKAEVVARLDHDWQTQITAGEKLITSIKENIFGDFIASVRKIADISSLRIGLKRESMLHVLVRHKDTIEMLKWLMKEFPYLDFCMTNRFDETPLHEAVLANNTAALRLILMHKTWQDRRSKLLLRLDARGRSPLALALFLGRGHCIFEILRFY